MTVLADWISTGPGAALAALAVTMGAFAALWRLSLRRADCGVVDLYWGYGFAVIAWIEATALGRWSGAAALMLACVTLWAVRLGTHLVLRHRSADAEDPRYAAMRQADPQGWPRRSFWVVFMLQAVVMWLVATPLHAVFLIAPDGDGGSPLVLVGGALFLAGFTLEAIADLQLRRFKANPANRGRLFTGGLFAWSRHPNYFGEMVLWWGLGLVAFAATGAGWAFAGPALLTWLLIRVSGIPPLETLLAERPGFADYAARTSSFVPMPPRRFVPDRRAATDRPRD